MSGAGAEDRVVPPLRAPTVGATPVRPSQLFSNACPKRVAVRLRRRA